MAFGLDAIDPLMLMTVRFPEYYPVESPGLSMHPLPKSASRVYSQN